MITLSTRNKQRRWKLEVMLSSFIASNITTGKIYTICQQLLTRYVRTQSNTVLSPPEKNNYFIYLFVEILIVKCGFNSMSLPSGNFNY